MTDSFPDLLTRLRSHTTCEPGGVGELIVAAGSIDELLLVLMKAPRPEDRPIVTQLIEYLTMEHREHQGLSVCLVACAYLLSVYGNVDDCQLIRDAKMANFSTFLGLNDVLLVGAGLEETVRFLRGKSARRWSVRFLFSRLLPGDRIKYESKVALKYIEQARKAGQFENREAQLERIRDFCLRTLAETR